MQSGRQIDTKCLKEFKNEFKTASFVKRPAPTLNILYTIHFNSISLTIIYFDELPVTPHFVIGVHMVFVTHSVGLQVDGADLCLGFLMV